MGIEMIVWLLGLTSTLPHVLYIFALNLYYLGNLACIFPGSIKWEVPWYLSNTDLMS